MSALAQDLPIPDNPYDIADEIIRNRNAFERERWFYEQRMYPFNSIPTDAYEKALQQRDAMRQARGFFRGNSVTWTSIGPTPGFLPTGAVSSRIPTIKIDPNNPSNIYLGAANGGVWKSTDGGSSWVPKTDNEVSLSSGALAIDPTNSDIIYYGTGEATYSLTSYYGRGLLKSTDGGDTWVNYTAGLPSSSYFSRLVIRPNHSNELLGALGTSGLRRSTNGGETWSVVVSGRCDDVVFSPSGDTAYATGSGTGYIISTDGGQSFTASGALTMRTRNHIALCKASPAILYTATYASPAPQVMVFKSTDAGTTFSQVSVGQDFDGSQAWYDFYIHVNPFDPNDVYVGTRTLWHSTDGGASFQYVQANLTLHMDHHNLDFDPTDPNRLFCVTDGGVSRSTNRGVYWTNLNSTLTLTQFYRITADPSNAAHLLGGTQDNGTQSTTGSMGWHDVFCCADGGEVCFQSQNPSIILGEIQYNGVFRSTNGGGSFLQSTTGLTGSGAWIAPIISHPDSANIFYTARQSVFKSTNGGASWFSISTGISGTIREMAISKSNPQIMFATIGASVYKSTNRGYDWSVTSSGLPNRTITAVTIDPLSSNVVALSFSGFGAGKVYRSSDTGTTWTNISGNLPDTPVNDVLIYPEVGTYIVATDVGVFLTANFGATWTELADGLPNTVVMHLDYHAGSNKLRIATHGRGVYETVVMPAILTLVGPTGGEVWPVGTEQTIQWNSSSLPGNVKIELSRNGGTTFPEVLFASTANTGSASWTVTTPASGTCRVRISSPSNASIRDSSHANFSIVQSTTTTLLNLGWNLVSVPRVAPDYTASVLFPGAVPGTINSFITGTYTQPTALENGDGYWAYYAAAGENTIFGSELTSTSVTVPSGNRWVLVGSVTSEVPVANLTSTPPGAIMPGTLYGYNGISYFVPTTLKPGKGYWVFVNAPCTLTVGSTGPAQVEVQRAE